MVDVNVDFTLSEDEPINVDFTVQPDVEYTADIKVETGTKDHNKLYNRDLPDQHPKEAITGLTGALDDLNTGLINETEARSSADENLQAQIDEISAETVTSLIGGANIEVVREGPRATINTTTYVFEQGIASDVWVINHNLNKRPSIILIDSAGTVFQAKIEYNSNNQVTIYLNGATTGKAYLN